MAVTVTSSRARAAPAGPGSRATKGRWALKMCVRALAPRSNAACAVAASASVWPMRTATSRATRRSIRSSAPGSSGASVTARDRSRGHQLLGQPGVGLAQVFSRMGAAPARRQERAFEVEAEHPVRAAIGCGCPALERPAQHLGRRARQRRLERGHAGCRQGASGGSVAARSGRQEVDPREAVDLQVHEAGHRQPGRARRRESHRSDAPVLDLHIAGHLGAAHERRPDAEPHRPSPRSAAQRESSCRLESCSLRSTDETCASTVFGEMSSRSAISLYM